MANEDNGREIRRETASAVDPEAESLPAGAELHSGRKQFIVHDFDPPRDKDMAVFTAARKLSQYVFVITEKSPKKLRWSIVSRLQNATVDVIENLYRANCERGERREEFQKQARVSLRLVDFFSEAARTMQAINMRQTEIIAKHIGEVDKLLSGWIRSTKNK